MKFAKHGADTLDAEVVHVSARGFWLYFAPLHREMFLSFQVFPWFADATIRELSTIEVERGHIIRWPKLDVDLDVERIEHPDRFPRVANMRASRKHARRPNARTGFAK